MTNSGRSGRGPTRLMSPIRTFQSCGSSSRRVLLRTRPTGVTRGSHPACATPGCTLGGSFGRVDLTQLQPLLIAGQTQPAEEEHVHGVAEHDLRERQLLLGTGPEFLDGLIRDLEQFVAGDRVLVVLDPLLDPGLVLLTGRRSRCSHVGHTLTIAGDCTQGCGGRWRPRPTHYRLAAAAALQSAQKSADLLVASRAFSEKCMTQAGSGQCPRPAK